MKIKISIVGNYGWREISVKKFKDIKIPKGGFIYSKRLLLPIIEFSQLKENDHLIICQKIIGHPCSDDKPKKCKNLFKKTHYKIVVHCNNCLEQHDAKVPIGTSIIGCKDKCPNCGLLSNVEKSESRGGWINNYIN